MSLSNPRIFFGVHSFTPYCRTTGMPYGTALVVGQSGFSLTGELANLNGGSNKYSWAVEETNITAELSLTVKQYENWMMQLFLGKAPTADGVGTGSVANIADKKGTVLNATWGIDTVQVKSGSESDLKFTKYVIEVVDAAAETVHVYALSNVDFAKGTDVNFQDDLLRVTESPLTITDGAAVEIPGFGLEIVGGSTVDFAGNNVAAGDTITFDVLPPKEKSISARFGASSDNFPEFGAIVVGQKRGNGEMVELDIFRLKAVGLPLGFQEKAFSEAEITAQAFYDADKNGVFDLRHITPVGTGVC